MKMKRPTRQETRSAGGGDIKPKLGSGMINSDGPHINNYKTQSPTGYHTGGYANIADNTFSQRTGLSSTVNEEESEQDEETLQEFFARIIKMPLTESDKKELLSSEEEKEDMEEELEEYSGAAAGGGGPATPLGTNAQGKVPTKSERERQLKYFSKSFGGY